MPRREKSVPQRISSREALCFLIGAFTSISILCFRTDSSYLGLYINPEARNPAGVIEGIESTATNENRKDTTSENYGTSDVSFKVPEASTNCSCAVRAANITNHQLITLQQHESRKLWCLIGISTAPRSGNEEYLSRVLVELSTQIPPLTSPRDPLAGSVQVFVRCGIRGRHLAFDKMKIYFNRDKRFYFSDHNSRLRSTKAHLSRRLLEASKEVRQQTAHVVEMIEEAAFFLPFEYFVFIEDDFIPCADAFTGIL